MAAPPPLGGRCVGLISRPADGPWITLCRSTLLIGRVGVFPLLPFPFTTLVKNVLKDLFECTAAERNE